VEEGGGGGCESGRKEGGGRWGGRVKNFVLSAFILLLQIRDYVFRRTKVRGGVKTKLFNLALICSSRKWGEGQQTGVYDGPKTRKEGRHCRRSYLKVVCPMPEERGRKTRNVEVGGKKKEKGGSARRKVKKN